MDIRILRRSTYVEPTFFSRGIDKTEDILQYKDAKGIWVDVAVEYDFNKIGNTDRFVERVLGNN